MAAAGVRSHSSAQKTSSSSSSEQNETVFLQPLLTEDSLSLAIDGDVRPELHGLGAALRSGVIGGVSLRQLLRECRVRVVGGSSAMSGCKGVSGRPEWDASRLEEAGEGGDGGERETWASVGRVV